MNGLVSYARYIPSTAGPIHLTYFNNLIVTGAEIAEIEKPSTAPDFTYFATYRYYLFNAARRVGENARASERRHRITPLATISRGYNSPATAVVAREAGARDAVTISQARRTKRNSLGLSDSGEAAARQLGLNCKAYSRKRKNYPHEDALWASAGNVGDINLAIFDYPEKLCLLFSGFLGDVLWDRNADDPVEPLRRKDTSGVRFSECRLELGVFNCAPVFWGCRKDSQVHAISKQREMRPWTLGTDYDRPIPRRLAEEAGIRKRIPFGTRKRACSFNQRYGRPLSADLREDFARFMARRGGRATSGFLEWASVMLRGLDQLVLERLPRAVRFSCSDWIRVTQSVHVLYLGE